MSSIGGPIAAGIAGAPEASRSASKAMEKRRNDEARQRRRFEDALELHVSGIESADAVHDVKEHASEDADSERQAKPKLHFNQRPLNNAGGRGLNNGYPPPEPPAASLADEPDSASDAAAAPSPPPPESLDVTG